MKKALITGITGQDGSYLAEFLLERGLRRPRRHPPLLRRLPRAHRPSGGSPALPPALRRSERLHEHPLRRQHRAARRDLTTSPPRAYVQVSFDVPEFTADVDATGVLRVLEAVRLSSLKDTCRIYQASTSELYGKVEGGSPEREHTVPPLQPLRRRQAVRLLDREGVPRGVQYVLLLGYPVQPRVRAPRRTFVTRKITLAAARIAQGKQDKLYLGNLSSLRDWGLCQGLRRVHVADFFAERQARGLRHRHR